MLVVIKDHHSVFTPRDEQQHSYHVGTAIPGDIVIKLHDESELWSFVLTKFGMCVIHRTAIMQLK